MLRFYLKATVFYLTSLLCCLSLTGITTVSIYLLLNIAGIPELGQMLLFKIGLGMAEVCGCIAGVIELSEKILYIDEKEEEEEEYRKVFDEEF